MDTEAYLKQAVEMFNSGDKQTSQRMLKEIVDQDPSCVDALYGLALCASTNDERGEYIHKILLIDPSHPKALRWQRKLHDQGKQDGTVKHTPDTETNAVSIKEEDLVGEVPQKKWHFTSNYIYAPVLVLIITFVTWQFFQIDHLKKSLTNAHSDIAYLKSSVKIIASGLDYVTPLAENGNRYAHSHPYSDARLKTDIRPIDTPLSKIMTLNGVYYMWDRQNYPQMSFSNDRQIGLIAQDVEAVFPELVTTDANGYKQVDYERMTAVLIEAIKEQQIKIEHLEQRLDHAPK